jgi:hypothetical protein
VGCIFNSAGLIITREILFICITIISIINTVLDVLAKWEATINFCNVEHNMLLNFPRCRSILLLQTSKIDHNALDIDAIYNLKLRKT